MIKRNTPLGKLNSNMASSIAGTLRGLKCGRHWANIVGYKAIQLKKHLEKQFKAGMTWENYGSYWHLDHKIPISAFNYERPEDIDFKRCWSLKNLQPLGTKENLRKGKKIEKPFQPSLRLKGEKI